MKRYDFKKTEDFRDCERLAYDGILDYTDFPPAAYRYFSELSKLYEQYRQRKISKHDAENHKRILLKNYHEALSAYEQWCNVCKSRQNDIKQTDIIRSDICKSDNINDIADMSVKALSILTGDTVLYKTFANKFGGNENEKRMD